MFAFSDEIVGFLRVELFEKLPCIYLGSIHDPPIFMI
jgi:hypothetical protein